MDSSGSDERNTLGTLTEFAMESIKYDELFRSICHELEFMLTVLHDFLATIVFQSLELTIDPLQE